MERETKDIEITEGRDAGKKFRITEFPAMQAAKLADFAISAAVRGGAAINPDLGLAAFYTLSRMDLAALSLMTPADMDYVHGKVFECVTVVNAGPGQSGSPSADLQTPRKPIPNDFEEIETIYRLRREVMELHLGFWKRSSP